MKQEPYFSSIRKFNILITGQATVTKYYVLVGLNNKNLFLIVLEAGRSKIWVLFSSVPGQGSLPSWKVVVFLSCPLSAKREKRESSLSL